ncbi:MAG TPA: FadD3 family acyl-CoA ligase, partial [Kofleriaceae bacterium]|nr:FadD3 family acyl-CoA ligase [Kofleriaceae bacterium]
MKAPATIPEVLARALAERPDAPAVIDGDVRLSVGDLAARVARAALALCASGVAPGDAVAIWAPNSWRWMVAALAVHEVGGVLVPINTRYKGDEAAHLLGRSRARLLFTVGDFLGADYVGMLAGRDADLPELDTVVVMSGRIGGRAIGWDGFHTRADDEVITERLDPVAADDPCDIMFTSGTTGAPKGVVSTHGQSVRVFRDWADLVGLRAGDRYLVVAPFFHTFGYKAGWLAALIAGATVYPQAVFDAGEVIARVARERITVLPGPPTLYLSMLAHPARAGADLSSLRLAVTGAAVVPVDMVRRMGSELGFTTVLTGYGLTESTGVVTLCRAGDDVDIVAGTCGRAIPGVEVAVIDDAGRPLPAGTPGEVVARGYNIMRGYVDDAEATAAAVDADGWLHTGDIGVLDGRGYLRITDRKKDMFIVGGFNAYPAEIEGFLLKHPAVAQVAVIGVPDERMGQVGKAFVVRHGPVTE